MVTMKQLAAHCGVSIATVSKALNNGPDISKETIARVQAAAHELGYHPNAAARALKTNRSFNIGLLFEDENDCGLTHEYFVEILNAVKRRVEESGYDVTFINRNLTCSSMSYLEHCRYRSFDGVVIACVDFTNPAVAELVNSEIPAVTIDYTFDGSSAVISDNAGGMATLLSHIYAQGHRRIAFLHGEKTAVTRTRVAAFHRFCAAHDLDVPENFVQQAGYHDITASEQLTALLLESKQPPTCILYPDDVSLMGGLNELQRRGLRVPEDISIAGYDGIDISRLLKPTLTTLCQDSRQLGKRAAELLLEAIDSPKTFLPQHEIIPGTLQAGGTVGPVPVTD